MNRVPVFLFICVTYFVTLISCAFRGGWGRVGAWLLAAAYDALYVSEICSGLFDVWPDQMGQPCVIMSDSSGDE